MRAPTKSKRGFTLIEATVVVAIVSILVGLLLPAVQAVRQAADRIHCQSNMKQLALAVHHYHTIKGLMPTYFGVDTPNAEGSVLPRDPGNCTKVYGGWFAHMLPYVEQDGVYNKTVADILASGWNEPHWDIVIPPGPGGVEVIVNYNGHTYVYFQNGNGIYIGDHIDGIWIKGVQNATYKMMQCPSDPSANSDGLVIGNWGATNYLANFNAWSWPGSNSNSPPISFNLLNGRMSTLVMFGEGYANCDTIGRAALYSWEYHNFGLDWYENTNTLMFQDMPAVQDCDNWRTQSGHPNGMNVALMDGSVRVVHPSISQATWTSVLLPSSNTPPGNDW
jgi:prepilin-type N-terminal cleavage/methylation domain-containing protein/prepilin-type processing-associated H-X9-DG protein